MAEDIPAEQGTASSEIPAESAPAPASPVVPAAEAPSWSWSLLALAALAVLLTMVGIFSLSRPVPNAAALGVGLLLWGLLDLVAQGRRLAVWKGSQAALSNSINLVRALALFGAGLWLCLMAVGLAHRVHPAVIIWTGVCLATLYLAATLALEAAVKGVRLGAQAYLMAALLLMLFSYYCFTIPFAYSWAAVLACLSFAAAVWSLQAGVLAQSPFLGLAALLAVLLLGTPLVTYTYQQAYEVEEQPLFTPTLLIPRMRQIVSGLAEDAGQIQWAPVHTQAGQPGDVRFSDKVAFVDKDEDGRDCVKLFQQHEDGLREILRVDSGEGVSLSAFSNDGSRLAFTGPTEDGATALYVLAPKSASDPAAPGPAVPVRVPFSFKHFFAWLSDALQARDEQAVDTGPLAYRSHRIYTDVAQEPPHGQVWRDLGRQLYFCAPPGGPRNTAGGIYRMDFASGGVEKLLSGRALPAVSPDGKALLSVGFVHERRNLRIADQSMVDGQPTWTGSRPFVPLKEAAYFPAWNEHQTEVLFIDSKTQQLMEMHSNGKDHRAFDPQNLDSHFWRSENRVPFMLQWEDLGDRFRIYRSRPDGSHEKLVYETGGREISAPQWSADGKRIAFIVRGEEDSEVVTVGSDGSWPRHFFTTQDALDELKWSPDGFKVAWICRRQGGAQEIWTADYEGLDPVMVHSDDGELKDLSWSPSGKHLAVQQTKDWTFLGLRLIKPSLRNVLMVNLLSRRAKVMTRYGILSHDPAFSPHGDAIAYFTDEHPWDLRPRSRQHCVLVVSQLY